jgi:hypothetical protein
MLRRLLIGLTVVGLTASPAFGQDEDYQRFAQLVAANLPSTNSSPVEVSPKFRCASFGPALACPPEEQDATPFAEAFAAALDIPVRLREGPYDRPPCPWATLGEVDEPGLEVRLGRPEVDGDTARIEVSSGCRAPRGFGQVHLFVFERGASDTWEFVSVQLTMIT